MPDVTIDDTLRETYASLRGSFESDFTPPAEPTEPVEPEEPTEPLEEPAEPQEPVEEPEEPTEPTEPTEPEPAAFRPPWKKAALAEWDKLPPLARAEIERRESDFHKGIEQYKAGAQASQEWERVTQPFMATIQSFGVTPQVAAAELFKADHLLRYSQMPQKVGMLLKIAGDYGVDLQTLANGIQQRAGEQVWQQQNPVDPRLQQLQQRVDQMQQQHFHTQQQAQIAEHSAIDSEIAAFAADPDHEHFGILQQDMALLLQAGKAKNLDDAYEMAMRQNPQTYQIWLAQQQQEWDAQRKAKVAQAKRAGANNVRPNGRSTVPSGAPANETMEQTLERVAREQGLIN
jgi:hypothetical protein